MKWADAATAGAARLGYPARSALKLLSLSRSNPGLLPRGSAVLDLGCSPGAFLQVAAEAVGEKGVVFGIDLVEVDVEASLRKRAPFLAAAAAAAGKKNGFSSPAPVFTRVADVFDLTPQTLSALFREAVEQLEAERQLEKAEEGERRAATAEASSPSAAAPPVSFGVVLSDLCHSTLGVRSADAARSLDLARAAARLALGEGGGGGGEAEGVLAEGGSFLVKCLEGAETPAFAAALKPRFDSVKWARPPATRGRSTEVYLLGLGRR